MYDVACTWGSSQSILIHRREGAARTSFLHPTKHDLLHLPSLALLLVQRYRALFALRNKGGEEAVAVLGEAFSTSSALLKHEVAYVMGQMQHPASAAALGRVLQVSKKASRLAESTCRKAAAAAAAALSATKKSSIFV
jgi:hypothetical protein